MHYLNYGSGLGACQIKQPLEFLTPHKFFHPWNRWGTVDVCDLLSRPLGSTHFTYMIICIRCSVSATCKLRFCCSVLHMRHLLHVSPSWQRDPSSAALPEVFCSVFFSSVIKFVCFFHPHGKFFLPRINGMILGFWAVLKKNLIWFFSDVKNETFPLTSVVYTILWNDLFQLLSAARLWLSLWMTQVGFLSPNEMRPPTTSSQRSTEVWLTETLQSGSWFWSRDWNGGLGPTL